MFVMQLKSPGFKAAATLAGLIPFFVSALVMAVCVFLFKGLFNSNESAAGLDATLQVIGGLLIGSVVYGLMLFILRVGEVRTLVHR